jgi:hypothetical protein
VDESRERLAVVVEMCHRASTVALGQRHGAAGRVDVGAALGKPQAELECGIVERRGELVPEGTRRRTLELDDEIADVRMRKP